MLIKRGWKGEDNKRWFCDELEILDHLFFGCKLAKYAWSIAKCATGMVGVPVHFQDMIILIGDFY